MPRKSKQRSTFRTAKKSGLTSLSKLNKTWASTDNTPHAINMKDIMRNQAKTENANSNSQPPAGYVIAKPLAEIQNRERQKAAVTQKVQAALQLKKEKLAREEHERSMCAQLNGTSELIEQAGSPLETKVAQKHPFRHQPSPCPLVSDFIPRTEQKKMLAYGFDYRDTVIIAC